MQQTGLSVAALPLAPAAERRYVGPTETMYAVADDRVIPVLSVPPCEPGAPSPMVLADEFRVFVAYYARATDSGLRADWDGLTVSDPMDEAVVLVEFESAYAHLFGPPNDEAFSGHPLASRGLQPYTVSEVERSSWIRALERMNAVHPYHRTEHFSKYRHFIFAFHDSTFECVAEGFQVHLHRGSVNSAMAAGLGRLAIDSN